MVEVCGDIIQGERTLDPTEWIYAADLEGEGTESCAAIWTLMPHRQFAIVESYIQVRVKGKRIELISDTYAHGVHCKDGGKGIFSDNYFDLLPGIPKTVQCLASAVPKNMRFRAV